MTNFKDKLPEDPREAERALIRVITNAYKLTPMWRNDRSEVNAIENDIANVSTPSALGLSPEFGKWESITTAAGVVWEVDDEGIVCVTF